MSDLPLIITLRINGKDLDPGEITALLERQPTYSCREGDVHRGPNFDRIEKTGKWHFELEKSLEPIDDQIDLLLDDLNGDLDVWTNLSRQFTVSLFVGVFLHEWNEEFELSAYVLQKLADRNISIRFDIYDPLESDD